MSKRAITHTLTWAILLGIGCSGGGGSGGCGGGGCGGCGGCGGSTGCLTPIPGGFPPALRQSEAVSVKVSPAGFTAISQQVPALLDSLLSTDGGTADGGAAGNISVNIPCIGPSSIFSVGSMSTIGAEVAAIVCDTGNNQCASAPNPPPSGECTANIKIDGIQMVPSENDATSPPSVTLTVTVDAEIDTTTLPVNVSVLGFIAGHQASACALQCAINFNTTGGNPPYLPIHVDVQLAVDETRSDILTFNVTIPDLSSSIPASDLIIGADTANCPLGTGTSFTCALLGTSTIEPTLFKVVQTELTPTIQALVDKYRCQACTTTADCPQTPMVSTCSSGLCMINSSTDTCVPANLGIEGRVNAGSLLASFGAPADAPLDVSAVAGGLDTAGKPSTVSVNMGLQVGMLGGTNDPSPASCVPPATWTPPPEPTQMDFDAEAALMGPGMNLSTYDVGLSVSDAFMNQALFDAWQQGLLCLNISSATVSELSTGLFSALLANLNELTQGQDVPMLIGLRPTQAPNIVVGRGTTMVVSGATVPDDALITLNIPQVHLDFYALIDERFERLFTLQTDLSVPVGLDFTPPTGSMALPGTVVSVLLGTLSAANTTALNNNMNVDTDANLAGFLPNVIGLITGPLTSALPNISVPAFDGLQLEVLGARGSIMNASGPGYEHLALFTAIAPPAMMDHPRTAHTTARIVDSFVPKQRLPADDSTQPRVVIDAKGDFDVPGAYEFTWRVDGGPWTFWNQSSTLVVADPILRIPGIHAIDVRSRLAGDLASADPHPAHVAFAVSYPAPDEHPWRPLQKSTWVPAGR